MTLFHVYDSPTVKGISRDDSAEDAFVFLCPPETFYPLTLYWKNLLWGK